MSGFSRCAQEPIDVLPRSHSRSLPSCSGRGGRAVPSRAWQARASRSRVEQLSRRMHAVNIRHSRKQKGSHHNPCSPTRGLLLSRTFGTNTPTLRRSLRGSAFSLYQSYGGWCIFLLMDRLLCLCEIRPGRGRKRHGWGPWRESTAPQHPFQHHACFFPPKKLTARDQTPHPSPTIATEVIV